MTEIETYMTTKNRVLYKSTQLIRLFGKDELNRLYLENKIEIRKGLNEKVIKLL